MYVLVQFILTIHARLNASIPYCKYIIIALYFRIPLPLCKKLGKITAKYRWFALVYLIGMFAVLPAIFMSLSFLDSNSIFLYIFVLMTAVILIIILVINMMQSSEQFMDYLPKRIRSWEYLPLWMRSLEPYDRYISINSTFH